MVNIDEEIQQKRAELDEMREFTTQEKTKQKLEIESLTERMNVKRTLLRRSLNPNAMKRISKKISFYVDTMKEARRSGNGKCNVSSMVLWLEGRLCRVYHLRRVLRKQVELLQKYVYQFDTRNCLKEIHYHEHEHSMNGAEIICRINDLNEEISSMEQEYQAILYEQEEELRVQFAKLPKKADLFNDYLPHSIESQCLNSQISSSGGLLNIGCTSIQLPRDGNVQIKRGNSFNNKYGLCDIERDEWYEPKRGGLSYHGNCFVGVHDAFSPLATRKRGDLFNDGIEPYEQEAKQRRGVIRSVLCDTDQHVHKEMNISRRSLDDVVGYDECDENDEGDDSVSDDSFDFDMPSSWVDQVYHSSKDVEVSDVDYLCLDRSLTKRTESALVA